MAIPEAKYNKYGTHRLLAHMGKPPSAPSKPTLPEAAAC